jgi:hypothetical protein
LISPCSAARSCPIPELVPSGNCRCIGGGITLFRTDSGDIHLISFPSSTLSTLLFIPLSPLHKKPTQNPGACSDTSPRLFVLLVPASILLPTPTSLRQAYSSSETWLLSSTPRGELRGWMARLGWVVGGWLLIVYSLVGKTGQCCYLFVLRNPSLRDSAATVSAPGHTTPRSIISYRTAVHRISRNSSGIGIDWLFFSAVMYSIVPRSCPL